MFGSDCRGCYSAHDYAMAQDRWHKTPRPRGAKWEPNERPLDNNRKHHYRLVQGDGEAHYDAVLYSTVMARYHKPTAEGRRVQYNYYPSTTSHNFMWRVLGLHTHTAGVLRLRTTGGRDVTVPIGTGSRFDGVFGADLWFTDTGVIDVSRSDHELVSIPKYTDEFKAWRRDVCEGFRPLTDILEFCAEEVRQGWQEPASSWRHPGELCRLSGTVHECNALKMWVAANRNLAPVQMLADNEFIDLARAAYKVQVQRSLDVRDYRGFAPPPTTVLARAATNQLLEDICKELWGTRSNVRRWGIRSNVRWEPLPKFVEHLPKNFRRT